MPPPSDTHTAQIAATAALFYLSHAFDWDYQCTFFWMNLRMMCDQKQIESPSAHRFLQWFVASKSVSTRDLDFNLHLSNSRYSRHADFARFTAIMATGFLPAVEALDCGLVVSAISQKFRRELPYGQKYQLWVRFVGWDDRHVYLEHVFCVSQNESETTTPTTNDDDNDRIRQQVTLNGSAEAVQQVVNLQTQVFHARPLVVASILTVRFTTTRTKIGQKIVTPEQIFHHMNLGGELPAVAPPPKDIVDWNQAVEVSSGRFTKNNMRSKL